MDDDEIVDQIEDRLFELKENYCEHDPTRIKISAKNAVLLCYYCDIGDPHGMYHAILRSGSFANVIHLLNISTPVLAHSRTSVTLRITLPEE